MVSTKKFLEHNVKMIGIVTTSDGKRVCVKGKASFFKHQKHVCVHANRNNAAARKAHGSCNGRCKFHMRNWRACIPCI